MFQTSASAQSRAIQLATHSPFTHVGLALAHDGTLAVYEAVGPVKSTPLETWIAHGEGGRVVVKRLRPPHGPLGADAIVKLKAAAHAFDGRPYDTAFGWADDRIYCSELVWKAYERGLSLEVGQLRHLRDFDLQHPAVRAKLAERYGNAIPLDEPVVAPADIAVSPLLETVLER